MNYSKNLKKSAIAKRVIISWVIVAVISCGIGVVLGYTLKAHLDFTPLDIPMREQEQEFIYYLSVDEVGEF